MQRAGCHRPPDLRLLQIGSTAAPGARQLLQIGWILLDLVPVSFSAFVSLTKALALIVSSTDRWPVLSPLYIDAHSIYEIGHSDMCSPSDLALRHGDGPFDAIDEFPMAYQIARRAASPVADAVFPELAAWIAPWPAIRRFSVEIHLIYQSAMHATRAAVYYLPHLDSPALRKRKLRIFVDDDGLPGGDTHHYQLTRAFRNIGAECVLGDEEFGEPEELCRHFDGETARFVRLAQRLYSRSLGSVVRGRGDVGRLDARACRRVVGAFSEIRRGAVFRRVLFRDGRRASCRGISFRHSNGAEDAAGSAIRNIGRRQGHGRALDGVWVELDRVVQNARPRTGRQ